MTELIVVNDDTTREDLVAALGYLTDTAKAIRRKGYAGAPLVLDCCVLCSHGEVKA